MQRDDVTSCNPRLRRCEKRRRPSVHPLHRQARTWKTWCGRVAMHAVRAFVVSRCTLCAHLSSVASTVDRLSKAICRLLMTMICCLLPVACCCSAPSYKSSVRAPSSCSSAFRTYHFALSDDDQRCQRPEPAASGVGDMCDPGSWSHRGG